MEKKGHRGHGHRHRRSVQEEKDKGISTTKLKHLLDHYDPNVIVPHKKITVRAEVNKSSTVDLRLSLTT